MSQSVYKIPPYVSSFVRSVALAAAALKSWRAAMLCAYLVVVIVFYFILVSVVVAACLFVLLAAAPCGVRMGDAGGMWCVRVHGWVVCWGPPPEARNFCLC